MIARSGGADEAASGALGEAGEPFADPLLGLTEEGLRKARDVAGRDRSVAETLQRSLLPRELPQPPGITVSARYVAAGDEAEVGGDWYDVIAVDGGRLGAAIGDVAGRGIEAAARMGHLQSALRAYALEGHGPAALTERMSRYARECSPRGMATLLFALVCPETGLVRMASAAHPPPLLLAPDGSAQFLQLPAGSPLGVIRFPAYEEVVVALEPGSTLVLYTDGLVESPELALDSGLERLRIACEGAAGSAEEVCERVLTRLPVGGRSSDDVALLALRLEPATRERLELRFPAEPESLADVRRELSRWLRARGADEDETYELLVASGEACANAIAHAYAPGEASYALGARQRDGEVEISISDDGAWKAPREEASARGLRLMRELTDSLELDHGAKGTTVRLRRRLRAGRS